MNQRQHNSYSEWLVVRCQLGETDAFELLVELWHRRLFLYALNRLGERESAQDVTQECLLSISRGIGSLSDPAAFPKWSYRILERRCVDWLRKTIREREQIPLSHTETEASFAETSALDSQLTVGQILGMLDPKLAALLRLYYLEELSIEEIAEINQVPAGTIKSRLYYARKLLGKALND